MSNLICAAASWLGVGLDRCQPTDNKAGETKPKPQTASGAEDQQARSFLEELLFGTSTGGGAVGCADSVGVATQNQKPDAGVPITPFKWFDGGVKGIPEICRNGVDDNLDGITDAQECYIPEPCEVVKGGTEREYYTGTTGTLNIGICRPGTETCMVEPDSVRAYYIRIFPDVTPFSEVCNKLDDDCDGKTDEDNVCGTLDAATPDAGVPDAAPACTPTEELCNGLDDDCNGLIDYYQKIGDDIRITNNVADSLYPSMVWNGLEYGLSWTDGRDGRREIYFVRIDSNGNTIGSEIRITSSDVNGSDNPSLVWNGSGYGIVWREIDNPIEVNFARLDTEGNIIGEDRPVADMPTSPWRMNSVWPSLVWNGLGYGVSWQDDRDGNEEIYFAILDEEGDKIGSDIRITNDSARSWFWFPDRPLTWNDNNLEYGLTWYDFRNGEPEVYFTRIDADGNKIDGDIRITDGSGFTPTLCWNGLGYGIVWLAPYRIFSFTKIDSEGNRISDYIEIASNISHEPSIVWNGIEYGLSWRKHNLPDDGEIYFTRVNADGNSSDGEVVISSGAVAYYGGAAAMPSLVWTGAEYGVSWADHRDENWEIYFARIGVCE